MHLLAYSESIDSATLTEINGIQDDQVLLPQADRFQIPADFTQIHAAAALGSDLTRARIITPSLETKRATLEIVPRERGGDVFNLEGPRVYIPKRPVVLAEGEHMRFQAAEDNAGADIAYGLVWLRKPEELPAMPAGDIFVLRATGTTTLTANAWTSVTLTLENDLPAGEYALVGFLPISATAIAARVLIPGQFNRPGVPGLAGAEAAACDFDPSVFNHFLHYEMGRFRHTAVPQFQFLASAGDTAEVVFLYLVKVG